MGIAADDVESATASSCVERSPALLGPSVSGYISDSSTLHELNHTMMSAGADHLIGRSDMPTGLPSTGDDPGWSAHARIQEMLSGSDLHDEALDPDDLQLLVEAVMSVA